MEPADDWRIFRGDREPADRIKRIEDPPPWRPRRSPVTDERWWPKNADEDLELPPAALQRGRRFHATEHIVEMVNAAMYLRRPLLVTGQPGSGKSSLIDAVAYELRLGAPLRWSVSSRSALRDAQYQYDAIGRLQQQEKGAEPEIGDFITLGALGTALLPTTRPRALLIDEIDKSDIDLPNDLLNVFEEGEFEIPELRRLGTDEVVEIFTSDPKQPRARVKGGIIACHEFPLMILTSNGEREFPAPFLRRCLRLRMPNPTGMLPEDDNAGWKRLDAIVSLHFSETEQKAAQDIVAAFKERARHAHEVATDQLLNSIYFVLSSRIEPGKERDAILRELMRELVVVGS